MRAPRLPQWPSPPHTRAVPWASGWRPAPCLAAPGRQNGAGFFLFPPQSCKNHQQLFSCRREASMVFKDSLVPPKSSCLGQALDPPPNPVCSGPSKSPPPAQTKAGPAPGCSEEGACKQGRCLQTRSPSSSSPRALSALRREPGISQDRKQPPAAGLESTGWPFPLSPH